MANGLLNCKNLPITDVLFKLSLLSMLGEDVEDSRCTVSDSFYMASIVVYIYNYTCKLNLVVWVL